MQTLFDQQENEKIISRINKLTPDSRPQWGKMNAAQMLAHLQMPLKVAFGSHKLKHSLIGILFGKMAKKQMLQDKPFKQNLPTAPSFKINDTRDFEKEKQEVIQLVQRMAKEGPDAITKNPHPFFGKMNIQEWDTLQWKHLDHHLTQFGV